MVSKKPKIKEVAMYPVWKSTKSYVHPALDFADGRAIISQSIPYNIQKINENTNETLGNKEVERITIITSEREHYRLNPEVTDFNITHYPLRFPRRWALASIQSFINVKESKLKPKTLLKELRRMFALHIEFPEIECYHFFPLWLIGTYLHPLFKAYPYVYVGGIKETGKTKALNVCSCLGFNSIFSGNMSTASLFRLIQNNRCSLFIDETEKLSNPQRAEDFRNILLNGYKRGSSVYRVEKEGKSQIVKSFECYSPKMLANIRGLEDVLESRCISFIMKRTYNKEVGEREVDKEDTEWQLLRNQMYLFSMTYWKDIKLIYEDLYNDTDLKNREWEIWKPIIAIAKFIDSEVYKEMIDFALRMSKEKKEENVTDTTDNLLANVLCEIALEPEESKFVAIGEIRDKLLEYVDGDPKWLNSRWVGRAVRRMGFKESRRLGTHREIKIDRKEVLDLAKRLDISLENATSQTSETTQTSLNSDISDVSDISDGSISKDKNDN